MSCFETYRYWLVAIATLFVWTSTPAFGSDCSLVASAMEFATKYRELKPKRNVPCKLQSRTEVERYLRNTIKTKIPPKRIENEGDVYKLIGLIPLDYNYLEGLIELYTSQLGGYYDADRDYYAMADWMPEAMQLPIAVHELTHALQDQYFNLDKFLDNSSEASDTLMARSALVEGDATAVMMDYTRSLLGQKKLAAEESVSGLMMQNLAGAMISSSLHQAPPSLQALLVFPYVSGLNFAHSLLRKNGYKEIDKAFVNLPVSTEEILHPEKFRAANRDFIIPELADEVAARISGWEKLYEDRLGEFLISTLLSTWISPQRASVAAAGWGGDKVVLLGRVSPAKKALIWITSWDTIGDANEFSAALIDGYGSRFGKSPSTAQDGASWTTSPVGPIEINRLEKTVTLFTGLSD